MYYIDSWATADRKVLVYFAPGVIQTFSRHCQRYPRQPESGGILLGRRRSKHFEVVYATTPYQSDEQSPTSFLREPDGHQVVATDLWTASGGEVGYVGEWHTHPEAKPTPSSIDRREWRLLTHRRVRAAPMVTAIVGTASLYVALVAHRQISPMMAVR